VGVCEVPVSVMVEYLAGRGGNAADPMFLTVSHKQQLQQQDIRKTTCIRAVTRARVLSERFCIRC
jgi:predicted kinase